MYQSLVRYNVINKKSKNICKCIKSQFCTVTPYLNQRSVLDRIAKEFNFTQLSDWYKLSAKVLHNIVKPHRKDFQSKVGNELSSQFITSPYRLLSSSYPEYDWLPWKFSTTPRNFWSNLKNQKKFVEWAAKEFQIQDMNDWYKISYQVHFMHIPCSYKTRTFVKLEEEAR